MKQKGFTLIELIIVIVILGILAVTAAPRFIDISSDARTQSLAAIQASVKSAAKLVHAKAAIAGLQNTPEATVNIGTQATPIIIPIAFGYPDGLRMTTQDFLKIVDLDIDDINGGMALPDTEFTIMIGFSGNTILVSYTDIDVTNALQPDGSRELTACMFFYRGPEAIGEVPSYQTVKNAC